MVGISKNRTHLGELLSHISSECYVGWTIPLAYALWDDLEGERSELTRGNAVHPQRLLSKQTDIGRP